MDAVTRALQTLGLGPGATHDEITRSYKDLVRVWHPDRLGGDPGLQERAQEKLKEINHAYQLLKRDYPGPRAAPPASASGAGGGVHVPGRPGAGGSAGQPPRTWSGSTKVFVVSGPGCLGLVAGLALLFVLARRHFLPSLAFVILIYVLFRLSSMIRRP